ncbi:MAG: acyl-CoA thioesterase [Gammaproteobacteria bacterium]|nr:acyl-CoA thioesterase [Gammaproteobacteria bacterium]
MRSKAIVSAQINRRIEFYDLDPMQIVWHGHYVKYFEEARCALLDKIEYNYDQMDASGFYWPIVDMRVKYVSSAKFKQEICIIANLVEYENRLKMEYRVTGASSQQVLTKGYTIQAAVDKESGELQFVSPPILSKKLANYL